MLGAALVGADIVVMAGGLGELQGQGKAGLWCRRVAARYAQKVCGAAPDEPPYLAPKTRLDIWQA
jgi:hypothetical protein